MLEERYLYFKQINNKDVKMPHRPTCLELGLITHNATVKSFCKIAISNVDSFLWTRLPRTGTFLIRQGHAVLLHSYDLTNIVMVLTMDS